MFGYLFKTALRSMRRNPFLTAVLVAGVGLGIAVSTTFVTTFYVLAGDPIPAKSSRLFYVQLDAWDPERPWDDDDPSEPPNQLTYMDAQNLMKSDVPTLHSAMYKAQFTVHPEQENETPFRAMVRLCYRDFFEMFDVPFQHGGAWDRSADSAAEQVVVLDDATNQRLFGGENSVGRTARFEDREFTVVGVLAPWKASPKFFDTHNGSLQEMEELYIPFNLSAEMEIDSSGNDSGWKASGPEFKDQLASESIWIQFWAQLDTPEQKERYLQWLEAYALDQRQLGRFQRPINNKLRSVIEWLHFEDVVPQEARILLIVSLLFLLVCSVNLIGILLGKFLSRAHEVGIRRALGASRKSVFLQHILECEMVGVLGGGMGLLLSLGLLSLIKKLFDIDVDFVLDSNMILVGFALALLSGLIAGAYPAWRICRIPPAIHLKAQ